MTISDKKDFVLGYIYHEYWLCSTEYSDIFTPPAFTPQRGGGKDPPP